MTAPPTSQPELISRLVAGRQTLMLGIRGSRTTDIVRIAHETGHHAILVDLEHSTMPLDVAAMLCATAGDLGMTALVRVPEREYGDIGRLLDCGAHGIVAPRIETPAEAADVARACRFAPRGQRSQVSSVPSLGMRPTPAVDLNPRLDAAVVVQVLIETPTGVDNAADIAAVDGVDMLALGVNDLTAELGIPGQADHPTVRAAVVAVADACRAAGKPLMLGGVGDPELFASYLPLGVAPLQLTGMDTDLLHRALAGRVAELAGADDRMSP